MLDEATRQDFVLKDSLSSWDGTVDKVEFDTWVMEHLEGVDDGTFEVQCRKLTVYLKKPSNYSMRKRRAKELFSVLDKDGDGKLNLGEVLHLARRADPLATEALTLFFHELDGKTWDMDAAGTPKRKGDRPQDRQLSLMEWVGGLLKTYAHRTDAEFEALLDGLHEIVAEKA